MNNSITLKSSKMPFARIYTKTGKSLRVFALAVTLHLPFPTNAQVVPREKVHAIIQKICLEMEAHYPFPDVSKKYVTMLKAKEKNYDNLEPAVLAAQLTQDLRNVHNDVHVRIYQKEQQAGPAANQDDAEKEEIKKLERNNYGFKNVELDNIKSVAYISIPYGFNCTQEGFEMAGHAMSMAAYSKYIIIDVRGDGGGAGGMGHFLASYFFNPGEETMYLNGFERDRKQEMQEYTFGYVPGKRLTKSKLFILTDRGTASACEGFAYAMQKLKKATVVGDTTAGAGIAGYGVTLEANLEMFLPVKMLVAPHTETGWEGTGVIPDVAASSEEARNAAMSLIDAAIVADPSTDNKEFRKWLLEDMSYKETNALPDAAEIRSICGKYSGDVTITSADEGLIFSLRRNGKDYASLLRPFSKDVYLLAKSGIKKDGPVSTRIYVNRNSDGTVDYLKAIRLLPNTNIYEFPKYKKIADK